MEACTEILSSWKRLTERAMPIVPAREPALSARAGCGKKLTFRPDHSIQAPRFITNLNRGQDTRVCMDGGAGICEGHYTLS